MKRILIALAFVAASISPAFADDPCTGAATANRAVDSALATNDAVRLGSLSTAAEGADFLCARVYVNAGKVKTGLATLAHSLLNGAMAANAFHLNGDDNKARKIVALNLEMYASYVKLAKDAGYHDVVAMLNQARDSLIQVDAESQPTPTAAAFFNNEDDARAYCPTDLVVWVNTDSGVNHEKGMRWYGLTRHGAYACQRNADAIGDRDTRNGQ